MVSEPVIRQLIADGESGGVEFKIKAPRPAELAERICGMANTRAERTLLFVISRSMEYKRWRNTCQCAIWLFLLSYGSHRE